MFLFNIDAKISDIIDVLSTSERCVFILQDKKLVGSISQGDLIRYITNVNKVESTPVKSLMNLNPISTTSSDSDVQRKLMLKFGITDLCIVEPDNTFIKIVNYLSFLGDNYED